jgi:hypothetical protein
VVHGRYQTLDLTRLRYERVEANEPCAEEEILSACAHLCEESRIS